MISIIAAIGKNNELGKDNKLLWHIKSDLDNFKKVTMNKYIVMGKNTYNSLPKTLEGRKYIVLSKSLKNIPNGIVFKDIKELMNFINSLEEEVIVIGGSKVYSEFIKYADRLYISHILDSKEADCYFPIIDNNWKITYEESKDNYIYRIYERN